MRWYITEPLDTGGLASGIGVYGDCHGLYPVVDDVGIIVFIKPR
jgi:hypothetical protein